METEAGPPHGAELAKLSAAEDRRFAIHDFLDWLAEQGIALMRFGKLKDTTSCSAYHCDKGRVVDLLGRDMGPCESCGGTGFIAYEREAWYHDPRGRDRLVFECLGIDYDGVERERRALLEWVRTQAETRV